MRKWMIYILIVTNVTLLIAFPIGGLMLARYVNSELMPYTRSLVVQGEAILMLHRRISQLERQQRELEVSRGLSMAPRVMTVTAYTAGPESTGKSPGHPAYGITASGRPLSDSDAWRVAAADPEYYPPGTRLKVAGVGTVQIVDTGNAIKGPSRLDIFVGMTDVQAARAWGVRDVAVQMVR